MLSQKSYVQGVFVPRLVLVSLFERLFHFPMRHLYSGHLGKWEAILNLKLPPCFFKRGICAKYGVWITIWTIISVTNFYLYGGHIGKSAAILNLKWHAYFLKIVMSKEYLCRFWCLYHKLKYRETKLPSYFPKTIVHERACTASTIVRSAALKDRCPHLWCWMLEVPRFHQSCVTTHSSTVQQCICQLCHSATKYTVPSWYMRTSHGILAPIPIIIN